GVSGGYIIGDPVLDLDMVKESVYLAFHRSSRKLFCVTLTLFDEDRPTQQFPNALPLPFKKEMSIDWMHEKFGIPEKTIPSKVIGGLQFGMKEKYKLDGFHIPLAMQIAYTEKNTVESITVMPTEEMKW
ncbi:pyocin immunity protein, partial [Pectobacterium brasiliense]